jgi:hypothetical protein
MISCGQLAAQYSVGLTQSSAVLILCQYPYESMWIHKEEFEAIKQLVLGAVSSSIPTLGSNTVPRKDLRPYNTEQTPTSLSDVNVYTDYEFGFQSLQAAGIPSTLGPLGYPPPVGEDNLLLHPHNFLFLMTHIKDFTNLPENLRVSQFPFEGGFVRKDLLSLTVRTYCNKLRSANDICRSLPSWWNPCFDLSTELHFFTHELLRRHISGYCNTWIFKPAQGSRALGHKVLIGDSYQRMTNIAEDCKHNIGAENIDSILREVSLSSEEGDSTGVVGLLNQLTVQYTGIADYNTRKNAVAQLVITNPLTVRKRKFDMRCFVFVRSFVPFEGKS